MSSALEHVRNITRRYFTDVLYIDDMLKTPQEFAAALEVALPKTQMGAATEETDIEPPKRRPIGSVKKASDEETMDEEVQDTTQITKAYEVVRGYKEAHTLMFQFQEENCKASPFYYKSQEQLDSISSQIERTHLTILDWALEAESGDVALEILENVFKNEDRMKLVLIYTLSPNDAAATISEQFGLTLISDTINAKNYQYMMRSNALIVVCKKGLFSAKEILDVFVELILSKYGYFPAAFFDVVNKIDEQSAKILRRFARPFDNALLLQFQSDGSKNHSGMMSKLVANHVNKLVKVDAKVFQAILEKYQAKSNNLVSLCDSTLPPQVTDTIQKLIDTQNGTENGRRTVRVLEKIKRIKKERWKNYFTKLGRDMFSNMPKVQDSMLTDIRLLWIQDEHSNLSRQFESVPEGLLEILKQQHIPSIIQEDIKWIESLIPSILLHILSDDEDKNWNDVLSNLVYLMKLVPYNEPSLEMIKDFQDGQFVDFFSTGDVLVQGNKLLFCLTPMCDTFRPKKVKYTLKFLVGEVISDGADTLKTGSEVYSVLPLDDGASAVHLVKWKCYEVESLNVTQKAAKQLLSKYKRWYRLEHDYAQQIINKYVSYHARVGVNELFIKEQDSVRDFYLF